MGGALPNPLPRPFPLPPGGELPSLPLARPARRTAAPSSSPRPVLRAAFSDRAPWSWSERDRGGCLPQEPLDFPNGVERPAGGAGRVEEAAAGQAVHRVGAEAENFRGFNAGVGEASPCGVSCFRRFHASSIP